MSNTVNVKLQDGRSVQYKNVPDNVSADEFVARVQQDYGVAAAEVEKVKAPSPLAKAGQVAKTGFDALARGAGEASIGALSAIWEAPVRDPDTGEAVPHPLLEKARAKLRADLPRPEGGSRSEQIASRALEGAGGVLSGPVGPLGPARAIIGGAAAGAAGEVGGQVGGAPGEVIGALTGAALTGLGGRAVTNRAALAAEALEGTTPQGLLEAQLRMEQARRQGINLNLSQAMQRASNIDDIVNELAQSRYGNLTIQNLRDQPEQFIGRAQVEKMKLPGVATSIQDVANRVQDAATQAIKQGQSKANLAFRQKLPPGTSVEPKAVAAFDRRLDEIIKANPNTNVRDLASKVKAALRAPKQEGPAILGPDGRPLNDTTPWLTDASQLKNAVDDVISNFGQSGLGDPRNAKRLDAAANTIRTLFDRTVATPGSPLREARQAYRNVAVNEVNPLRKSVTGRMAGYGADEAKEATYTKLEQVFKRGTPTSGRSEILTLEKDLRKVDPNIFPDAVKTYLSDAIDKAMKSDTARTPEGFAKALNAALQATPMQKQGLKDMLAGVARSKGMDDEKAADFIRGVENFFELSTRLAIRPPRITGLPRQDIQDVAGASKVASAAEFQYWTQTGRKIRRAFSADAYRTLDTLLNTPEGVDTLQVLAKRSIMSPQAINAVGAFYGSLGAQLGIDTEE